MKKTATFAAAAAFAALAATGAQAQDNKADQCVWDTFNEVADVFKDLPEGTSVTLTYSAEDFNALTTDCETRTGEQINFFKGLQSLRINNLTFEMK